MHQVNTCGGRGQGKIKAASFAGNATALNPDAPTHGFNQVLADIESQPTATYFTERVAFQTHKLAKKQMSLFRRDAWPPIFDADTNLGLERSRINGAPRTNQNGLLARCVFNSVGKKITQQLAQI